MHIQRHAYKKQRKLTELFFVCISEPLTDNNVKGPKSVPVVYSSIAKGVGAVLNVLFCFDF